MFFDFCVGTSGASGPPFGLDTIYWIWGDATYQTPRKAITPGKTYIAFTSGGQGQIRYDGRSFTLRAGEYLAMRPHEDFSYGCPGEQWRFWWFELALPQPFIPVDSVCAEPVGDFVPRLLHQCLIHAKQARWDIAQSLFQAALMMLAHSREQSEATAGERRLAGAEQYIRENLRDMKVSTLCEHLGLQDRTLRNLCRQAFGLSPKELISRIRLETAQQLLVNTTMPLGLIASAVGYSSQFHFSRCFREQYITPPGEYRRQSV